MKLDVDIRSTSDENIKTWKSYRYLPFSAAEL